MWRELIDTVNPEARLHPPATVTQLAVVEQAVGVALPDGLRGLLLETNGVEHAYGYDLIWPADRIIRENIEVRTATFFIEHYMPLDSLLFFADAGNGDLFGFPIIQGVVSNSVIFVWDHEDDSRTSQAVSLKRFVEAWGAGAPRI